MSLATVANDLTFDRLPTFVAGRSFALSTLLFWANIRRILMGLFLQILHPSDFAKWVRFAAPPSIKKFLEFTTINGFVFALLIIAGVGLKMSAAPQRAPLIHHIIIRD